MPKLTRDDGAELSWTASGEGPLVVLAAHWNGNPDVLAGLVEELSRDHRVITYDLRGTGASTREGPFDLDTDSGDLLALVEQAGEPAALIGWGDGALRTIRVARERPELVAGIVAVGANPLGQRAFSGTDSPAGSEAVQEAFARALRTDFRSTLRGLLRTTNPQMDEGDVRARVDGQIEYCPEEVALARYEVWLGTDGIAEAAALDDRTGLRVLLFESGMGPLEEIARRISELVPNARVETIEEGPISRPDLTADAVREITAPLRAGAGSGS
jgi:pimeloyl-ACP methyl ester carboxylesterase